jgi:colicin import membrane protein
MGHIRQRENPVMWQAGALSLLVHGAFFALLVMTFSWKTVPPMQVAEVELWDSLPTQKIQPQPEPPKPEPVIKPEPQPEPPPPPEPKAEIQVKPKPPAKPKPEPKPKKEEPPKPDPKLQAKEEAKKLEELKRMMLAEDDPAKAQKQEAQQIASARNAQAQATASSGALDAAKARIIAKIKRNVNRQLCGNGKPVLEFGIALMPTGEVIGNPKLLTGSGISACDQAVERAILQSQPLPVPREPELFAQLRELNLKFRPNDDN